MNENRNKGTILGLAAALVVMTLALPAVANDEKYDQPQDHPRTDQTQMNDRDDMGDENPGTEGELSDTRELVDDAVATVEKMKQDPHVRDLLLQAKGVFIVPDYGKGAFIVGARGGSGVMLARNDDGWSSPAFYDIGGVSLGAQVGGEAGEIAMILMSDMAVNSFYGNNTFSLNADAGLTVINYSAKAQGSLGKAGDVVVWSDTEGALLDASVSVSDVSYDEEENQAYYGTSVTAQQILKEGMSGDHPQADELKDALPTAATS